MVQVIMPQTKRMSAFDEAMSNSGDAISDFGVALFQKKEDETKRQQALNMESAKALMSQGLEVTPESVSKLSAMLSGQQEKPQGIMGTLGSLFSSPAPMQQDAGQPVMQQAVQPQEGVDASGFKYTPKKLAEMEASNIDRKIKAGQYDDMYDASGNRRPFMQTSKGQEYAYKENIDKKQRDYEQGIKQEEKLSELKTPYGIANTPDDAKKRKESSVSKKLFDSKLNEMIALREKHGGGASMNRDDVARGKQLSKDLLLEYKNMAKLGTLSQSDEDIINAIIPSDPLEYNSPLAAIQGQDPILSNMKKFKKDSDFDFQNRISTSIKGSPVEQQPASGSSSEIMNKVKTMSREEKIKLLQGN